MTNSRWHHRSRSVHVLLFGTLLSGATVLLAGAQPPAPAPSPPPFEIAALDKTSWYGRFGPTNCAWIELGDSVLLIDTGASAVDAGNLAAKIRETTKNKPIRWIVLTHLHADSNNGLKSFLPTDATLFVHTSGLVPVAAAAAGSAGKSPTVVGVSEPLHISYGSHILEIGAVSPAAHSGSDLYVFSPESHTAYVGDLVTPSRCPMLSDPQCDLTGWLKALDRIEALHPAILVPTRSNATPLAESELVATRNYLQRVQGLLQEFKKDQLPEAQVASELFLQKLGDYCPKELDNINVLSHYQRMTKTPGSSKPPVSQPKAR